MDVAELVAARFDGASVDEFGDGHQARVFRVVHPNRVTMVAKVLDAAGVDRGDLETRVEVVAALADLEPIVCRPLPLDHRLVTELTDDLYLVCYEHGEGVAPDASDATDAAMMGRTLSRLHRSLAQLPRTGLPLVAALRSVPPAPSEPSQLLHGDYNASNVRQHQGVVRVFDLDDCGYGPPAFDVANALYMVLFDAVMHDTGHTYRAFRQPFVSAYRHAAQASVDDDVLDRLIDLRVDALRSWLDEPTHAPVGIRNASPAWRDTLRSFVTTYRSSG
jgi:Ser/Thr protein kinase RdoA (MazF antagonist)